MLKRFISKYSGLIILSVVMAGLFGAVAFENYQKTAETNRKAELAQEAIEKAKLKETAPVEAQAAAPTPQTTIPAPTISPSPSKTTSTPVVPNNGCSEKIPIPRPPAYREEFQYWYPEQSTFTPGLDGWRVTCPGKPDFVYEGYADRSIIGTRVREAPTPTPTPTPTQDYAAKQKCDSDYAAVRYTAVNGSSAQLALRDAYSRCLTAAGF